MNEQREHFHNLLAASLKVLQPYFDDPAVVEIMCNGDGSIWVEADGHIQKQPTSITPEAIKSTVLAIASSSGRAAIAGTDTGIVDAEIPLSVFSTAASESRANMRLSAVMAPTALRGNAMCIRKHSPKILKLSQYSESGAFSPVNRAKQGSTKAFPFTAEQLALGGDVIAEFLHWMLVNKKTALISGATGSGKTTFFKSLIQEIPSDERLLTLEDTPELVVNVPNYVSFQTAVKKGVTAQLLVKAAMRFRPDRILLGELRDETAMNFIEAANTGHPGSIATLHANDATNALARLESLALEFYRGGTPPTASVRARILSTIDFVIQIGKDGRPGVIEEIVQILPDAPERHGYSNCTRSIYSRYL